MSFILGTKEKMIQVYKEDGSAVPSTLLSVATMIVTQVKTKESDGYDAIQVGFLPKKEKNVNKAQKGHLGELGGFQIIKEFRIDNPADYKKGDEIKPSVLAEGDKIVVSGISKGKGFQGVVKRHGFAGGPRSHGQRHTERAPGSIGATGPQRVFKGTRMGGRMGADRITVKNLKVVSIDEKNGKLLVSGAVPGHRGTLLEIRKYGK